MVIRGLDEVEVRGQLTRLAEETGGVRALAKALGVSPSYVSDVLNGRRAPGPPFLAALGLKKVVVYVSVKTEA